MVLIVLRITVNRIRAAMVLLVLLLPPITFVHALLAIGVSYANTTTVLLTIVRMVLPVLR